MNAKVAFIPTENPVFLGKGTFAFEFYDSDLNDKIETKKKVSTLWEGDHDGIRGTLGSDYS
ncbi:MAG: hypothetical protein JSW00_19330 [Thermoplasmata archaeon]|nr:MAG: hypothetical protein JSW00_19330 [Thermoplasmata archaeon]